MSAEATVEHGSRVSYREPDGGVRTIQIYDGLAPSYTTVRSDSPLGRAVMGRRVGDEVVIELHGDVPDRTVTIVDIEAPARWSPFIPRWAGNQWR